LGKHWAADSHGVPLALLELPSTWAGRNPAGGIGVPDSQPVSSKIEQTYVQRLGAPPTETQLLMLTSAAEPLGDPEILRGAVANFGLDMSAAAGDPRRLASHR
jgi:hypothetical protein